MFYLFKRTGWKFPPKFKTASLCSPTALEKYKGFKTGLGFFRKRVGVSVAEDGVSTPEAFDPNRDISQAVENLKTRYVFGSVDPPLSPDPARCKAEMLFRTWGYHPKSTVCQACPLAAQCSTELESLARFPVLALRSGRITAQEAQKLAAK
jgi:hypothetical protein